MDERTVKRLLITVALAIGVIMLAKFMLTNMFTRLNQASANKKQAAVRQHAPPAVVLSQTIILPESAPASAVPDAAASAVEAGAQ